MNVAIAFGAGMLSFLSPCVLPLVPVFLVSIAGEAALAGTDRRRTLFHATAFVVGFSLVFTAFWVVIALAGALAGELKFWLERLGGALLVAMGLHLLGLITLPFLMARPEVRFETGATGYPRSFLIGTAVGVGFTPCVGPYLAVILTLMLNTDVASGAALLLAYALGVGVPFLLIASGLGAARAFALALRRRQRVVNTVGGTLVIAMGLLLLSGQFTRLAQLFTFVPAF